MLVAPYQDQGIYYHVEEGNFVKSQNRGDLVCIFSHDLDDANSISSILSTIMQHSTTVKQMSLKRWKISIRKQNNNQVLNINSSQWLKFMMIYKRLCPTWTISIGNISCTFYSSPPVVACWHFLCISCE